MKNQHHPPASHNLYSLLLCLPLQSIHAQQLSDPTRPYTGRTAPASSQHKPKSLQLQAIYRFAGERLAIIDGALVREGDLLNQLKIQVITDDQVRYTRKGVSGVLYLPGSTPAGTLNRIRSAPTKSAQLSSQLHSAQISSEPTRSKDLP